MSKARIAASCVLVVMLLGCAPIIASASIISDLAVSAAAAPVSLWTTVTDYLASAWAPLFSVAPAPAPIQPRFAVATTTPNLPRPALPTTPSPSGHLPSEGSGRANDRGASAYLTAITSGVSRTDLEALENRLTARIASMPRGIADVRPAPVNLVTLNEVQQIVSAHGSFSSLSATDLGTTNISASSLNVSGNVGIGTSSPYAKLSVVGPVVAEYVNATSTTATSTFSGGLAVGNTVKVYQNGAMYVNTPGLANATSNYALTVGLADFSKANGAGANIQLQSNWNCDNFISSPWGNLIIGRNVYWDNSSFKKQCGVGASYIQMDSGGNMAFQTTDVSDITTMPTSALSITGAGLVSVDKGTLSLNAPAGMDAFSVGSTTKYFTIDSKGNVGVGTASPSEKLSVSGNVTSTGNITAGSGGGYMKGFNVDTALYGGTAAWYSFAGAYGMYMVQPGEGKWELQFKTSNAEKALYLSDNGRVIVGGGTDDGSNKLQVTGNGYFSGNVGIGTTDPQGKLHVSYDTSSAAGKVILQASNMNQSTSGADIIWRNSMSADFAKISGINNGVNAAYLAFSTYTENAGNTEKMRINQSGNVGIGTTDPQYKLDVSGAGRMTGNLTIGEALYFPGGYTLIWRNGGHLSMFAENDFTFYAATAGRDLLTLHGSNGATFTTGATFTGNVGIGTTTPTLGPLVMDSGAYVTTGGTWTNASSRSIKENFATLDKQDILAKIQKLDITKWNYKKESSDITHIGPVAEDFYSQFGLGGSNSSISTIDPAGVALVGVQALAERLSALEARLGTTTITVADTATSTIDLSTASLADVVSATASSLKQWAGNRIAAAAGWFGQLTVGSPDRPSGITMYDEATRQPYCFKILNGQQVAVAGTCESPSPSASASPAPSPVVVITSPTPTDTATSTPTVTPTPTSTETVTPSPSPTPTETAAPTPTDTTPPADAGTPPTIGGEADVVPVASPSTPVDTPTE